MSVGKTATRREINRYVIAEIIGESTCPFFVLRTDSLQVCRRPAKERIGRGDETAVIERVTDRTSLSVSIGILISAHYIEIC